jgi:hypothetical protein
MAGCFLACGSGLPAADDPVKTTKLIALSVGAAFAALSPHASAFQNLNFERANPVIDPNGFYYPLDVTAASALPGWTAYVGDVQQTDVILNALSDGTATVDIFGPGWNSVHPGIIAGNYSVMLQSGLLNDGVTPENASIAQFGTLPLAIQSLQFKAWSVFPTANFSVSFAGNTLSPVVLSSGQSASGQDYNVYGVNLASYAGQYGQIEITALFNQGVDAGNMELDDISFSTTVVSPEPNIVALTAIGGLLFTARKWFARR